MPGIKINQVAYKALVNEARKVGTSIHDLASMIIADFFKVLDMDEFIDEPDENTRYSEEEDEEED